MSDTIVKKRYVLRFPPKLVDQYIVSDMVKKFDLVFNILKAYVDQREEGLLVMELGGQGNALKSALDYVKGLGVIVEPLDQDVKRNEESCTHCGACITICPSGALVVDEESRRVHFEDDKCIACEMCINTCPVRAMEIHF